MLRDVATWRDEYPFESHFLSLGQHRVHYLDEGSDVEAQPGDTSRFKIITYIESRFDILEAQERLGDILALVEEFREWGDAEEGDEIGYYICPSFD